MINTEEDWKTTDLNVDSLWLIDKRDSSGKHENNYHGNFIPQIPNQLIRRYTNHGDTVLELFTGSASGTEYADGICEPVLPDGCLCFVHSGVY